MEQTICIIEDDEDIQDVLRIILRKAGYETSIFSDGKSVLENNHPLPDLYLVDKQLQGFDGLNICKYLKVREETKQIPVIMMSAYPHIEELALNAGADGFIEKPFPMHALLKIIQTYLPRQKAEQVMR